VPIISLPPLNDAMSVLALKAGEKPQPEHILIGNALRDDSGAGGSEKRHVRHQRQLISNRPVVKSRQRAPVIYFWHQNCYTSLELTDFVRAKGTLCEEESEGGI
jgi:hypothetical protein